MLGMSAVAMAGGDVGLMMEGIGQSGLAAPAKFAVAFPFIYHYTLGIRHVVRTSDTQSKVYYHRKKQNAVES